MAWGQWLHHFGRIAVEYADTGSDIKLDSMKLPSAMILWGESLDFYVTQMEGILGVFKLIEKIKVGRFWTVVIKIREKIKAAVVDEAHLIAEW